MIELENVLREQIFGIDLNHCRIGLTAGITGTTTAIPTTGLTTATPKTTITFVINWSICPGQEFPA